VSSFFSPGVWIGNNRAAILKEDLVKPGEVGTFVFRFKGNGIANGDYREYFCPLIEGVTWMKDVGIYWDINVNDFNSEGESTLSDYDYEYIAQSGNPSLFKGQKTSITLTLKNVGKKDWVKGQFSLGTSREKDRESIFASGWGEKNRIALDQAIVRPGELGTFTVDITAPMKNGVYKEYFRPLVEGIDWLKDQGIYWKIKVN